MRNLLYVSALVALGGCLSQSKFEDKFAEKYCEEFAACTTDTAATCPFDAAATATATGTAPACEFDKAKAKECLDGTWSCNTDFPGLEYVVTPQACLEYCGAGTTADTDGTDTDAAM